MSLGLWYPGAEMTLRLLCAGRIQCAIEWQVDGKGDITITLTDLGSHNGTWVSRVSFGMIRGAHLTQF